MSSGCAVGGLCAGWAGLGSTGWLVGGWACFVPWWSKAPRPVLVDASTSVPDNHTERDRPSFFGWWWSEAGKGNGSSSLVKASRVQSSPVNHPSIHPLSLPLATRKPATRTQKNHTAPPGLRPDATASCASASIRSVAETIDHHLFRLQVVCSPFRAACWSGRSVIGAWGFFLPLLHTPNIFAPEKKFREPSTRTVAGTTPQLNQRLGTTSFSSPSSIVPSPSFFSSPP